MDSKDVDYNFSPFSHIMKTHGRSIHKLVPACVYDVLYTLVFVVANKLGTGQPDLLWHAGRT